MLRLYARHPARAAVDRALLERVRGLLPVPRVLEAATGAGGTRAAAVPAAGGAARGPAGRGAAGRRRAAAAPARRGGGRGAGAAGDRADAAGRAGSPTPRWIRSRSRPPPPTRCPGWTRTSAGRGSPGLSAPEREALRAVARQARELARRATRVALVHADVNPKNLLVDPATGGVTGVLDWEFAYAGSPLGDVGNLLRFETPTRTSPARWRAATQARAPDVPAGLAGGRPGARPARAGRARRPDRPQPGRRRRPASCCSPPPAPATSPPAAGTPAPLDRDGEGGGQPLLDGAGHGGELQRVAVAEDVVGVQ